MNITLYSFTKRKNSTARPTSGGTNYTGTLKANTSVVSPSVIFEFSAFPSVNYAYIQEFSRYYWITDKIQLANNLWQLDMHVDVLASYKTEIGSSSKYVLRSASRYNGTITDLKYPVKTDVNYARQTINIFNGYSFLNTYVLGVVAPSTNPLEGAVTYFLLNDAEMRSLRNTLMTGANYFGSITDPDIQNFALLMGNPMQYIKSCVAYPYNLVSIVGSVNPEPMILGNINCGSFPTMNQSYLHDSKNVDLTAHPEDINRGTYMNVEPFTQRYLYWSQLGIVHLPSVLISERRKLTITADVDLISGIGRLKVESVSTLPGEVNGLVYETNFTLGYDVPLAQVVTGDPLKVVSATTSVIGAGLSAMTGNIGGLVTGAASAIGDFMAASVPNMTGYMAGGGCTLRPDSMELIEAFFMPADANVAEYGRPLMKTVTISTLAASSSSSGYVLCADGEIAIDGCEPEITEIESYLTGGFFYE